MEQQKIAIIHPGSAYLPEIIAYQSFFARAGFEIAVFQKSDLPNLQDYAVEWHLMGQDRLPKTEVRLKIHEYISPSLPPLAKWKNQLKRWTNVKPDLRIFQNPTVRQAFNFQDDVPFLYRDAGIGAHFFETFAIKKNYDFVYHGSMHPTRRVDILLEKFAIRFQNYNLLIIGDLPNPLLQKFQTAGNIKFAGRIAYQDIPQQLAQARFGLNYIPNVYPYNLLPALKLLEYCALQLPIVTTDYHWVNELEQSRDGRFFKIKPDWSNFKPDAVMNYDYKTPNVADLQWEKILIDSGILQFIQNYLGVNQDIEQR